MKEEEQKDELRRFAGELVERDFRVAAVLGAIQSDCRAIMTEAGQLVVRTASDRQTAANLWDALRAFRKQAADQKEERCRPFKTAWEQAKNPFDLFARECEVHETKLRVKMNDWDRAQIFLAEKEQARLQAKTDAANAKIQAKADEQGIEVSLLKVAPVVAMPPKSITTQAGTTQTRRTHKVWTIGGLGPDAVMKIPASDPRLIDVPRECLRVEPTAINCLVRVGMAPSCVVVVEEYSYTQRGGGGGRADGQDRG